MEQAPRYLGSTFASTLSEYHNAEVDRVRNAFTSAGFVRVAELPSHIRCGAVLQSRTNQIMHNRAMRPRPPKRIRSLQLFGVFQQPEHVSSTSEKAAEESPGHQRDRVIARILSPKPPFVCTGAATSKARSPAPLLQDSSTLPHLSMSTITQEAKLSQKSLDIHAGDKSTFLAGRFQTTSKLQEEARKGVERDLKPIAKAIYQDLCQHWPSLKFAVSSPDGKQICVTIDEDGMARAVVPDDLLNGYLSALTKEGRLGEHVVFRDPIRWGVSEEGQRIYTFWPGWERVFVLSMTRKRTAAKQRSRARAYGKSVLAVQRPRVLR